MRSKLLPLVTILLVLGCSPKPLPFLFPFNPEIRENEKLGGLSLVFKPMVDILFVIDNSQSMSNHQQSVARNMDAFIDNFRNSPFIYYNIGVLSSDMDSYSQSGRIQGAVVSKGDPNGLDHLRQYILGLGIGGSFTEAFFDPVIAGLSSPIIDNENKGFLRKEAFLAVVFVTDAEDQSGATPEQTASFLWDLKGGDHRKVMAYGAVIPSHIPDSNDCRRDGSGEPFLIEKYLQLLDGQELNICDPDFGVKLAGIGADLVKRVGTFIPLTRTPQVNTIEVTYGTQTVPKDPFKGWTYDPAKNGLYIGRETHIEEELGAELNVSFIPAAVQ